MKCKLNITVFFILTYPKLNKNLKLKCLHNNPRFALFCNRLLYFKRLLYFEKDCFISHRFAV